MPPLTADTLLAGCVTAGSGGATRDERLGDVGLIVLDEVCLLGEGAATRPLAGARLQRRLGCSTVAMLTKRTPRSPPPPPPPVHKQGDPNAAACGRR